MISRVLLVLLVGSCASGQLSDVEISNIDRVNPPSFVTTNVSISFNMNCVDETGTCFTRTGTTPGTFQRATFVGHLVTALNAHAASVNTAAGNAAAAAWTTTAAAVQWDRVVEATSPFAEQEVQTIEGTMITDTNYWNVFVRFTLIDVPVEVAADVKQAIGAMTTTYPGISFNSLWVSTDAFFITEQLEPVKGRGHKDRKLLIPLILGVFSMLTIPTLITWVLVQMAQGSNKAEEVIAFKSKVISEQNNTLAGKNSALVTHEEAEEARKEEERRSTEMKQMRDRHELTEEDVDWEAQRLTNQPFGN
eukprot:TRINITY_DN713_c0_g1_i3.p1 TRINITY_DN713_c0_g1~~TRINITY_DN713_c0_g1_i3.p1  ORF type:complete len:324 (+),score=95.50 TRINITY_DN713_c0_g1_i3:55-972(+)